MAQRNSLSKAYKGRGQSIEELATNGTPEQREAAQRYLNARNSDHGTYGTPEFKAAYKEFAAAHKHLRDVMGWTRIANASR
jgi:hypothetical protein